VPGTFYDLKRFLTFCARAGPLLSPHRRAARYNHFFAIPYTTLRWHGAIMAVVCRNCSRVNPPEAHYCYWDGAVLDGRARDRGPIAVGAQPFLSPFVFPSGRQCRNLNEHRLVLDQPLDLIFFVGPGRMPALPLATWYP